MTDFFKNNPIALRHCLLYEYLQKYLVEDSFNIFCKTVGDDIVKKEEFYHWFNQFEEGIFDINDDKKPIADMREVLRNDKYALRACILYEALKYKLKECVQSTWPKRNSSDHKIFSIYKHFCNVVGEDVMEYQVFDFWFYHFLNGDYDLNYETDKDKKVYELMDMPVDVMENIVEYLDIFDRIKLAKTSRSLHTFVEDQKLFHRTLKLSFADCETNVSFGNSVDIQYVWNYAGCDKIFKNSVTNVQGVPYWKQAFLDLKSVLKIPNLHLNTLAIESEDENRNVLDDLEDALEFTHYLNVKKLILREYSVSKLLNIIPSLKPGYLSTIDIGIYYLEVDSMEGVFEMDQWKQANYFTMTVPRFNWPLRHLYHSKEFFVNLERLSVEDVREMEEILFKSPDFEKCSLTLYREIDKSIIAQELGNALRKDPYDYHYPIPNSTDYFEIKVSSFCFEVTRKKN